MVVYLAAMPRSSSGITFEDLKEELKTDELVKRLKVNILGVSYSNRRVSLG